MTRRVRKRRARVRRTRENKPMRIDC